MAFAFVVDGVLQAVGRLPGSARLLDTGEWFMPPGGLRAASEADRAACGWFDVADTPPVYDSATEVLERGAVILVDGFPVVDYTVRDKTADEIVADADQADRAAKRVSVAQAIPWLRDRADTAHGLNVTSTNAVAVLADLVDNVGDFYDHFADFLEAQRFDGGNAP